MGNPGNDKPEKSPEELEKTNMDTTPLPPSPSPTPTVQGGKKIPNPGASLSGNGQPLHCSSGPHSCRTCGRFFSSPKAVNGHMRMHKAPKEKAHGAFTPPTFTRQGQSSLERECDGGDTLQEESGPFRLNSAQEVLWASSSSFRPDGLDIDLNKRPPKEEEDGDEGENKSSAGGAGSDAKRRDTLQEESAPVLLNLAQQMPLASSSSFRPDGLDIDLNKRPPEEEDGDEGENKSSAGGAGSDAKRRDTLQEESAPVLLNLAQQVPLASSSSFRPDGLDIDLNKRPPKEEEDGDEGENKSSAGGAGSDAKPRDTLQEESAPFRLNLAQEVLLASSSSFRPDGLDIDLNNPPPTEGEDGDEGENIIDAGGPPTS